MEILHAILPSVFFLSKLAFSKTSYRNITRVSNNVDPDQAQQYIGPDLGPNCLQRLSADDIYGQGKINEAFLLQVV